MPAIAAALMMIASTGFIIFILQTPSVNGLWVSVPLLSYIVCHLVIVSQAGSAHRKDDK